jgi:hypothetical protein
MNSRMLWEELHLYRRTWAQHAIHWAGMPSGEARDCRNGSFEVGPYRFPHPTVAQAFVARIPRDQTYVVYITHEALMYRFPYGHPDRHKRGERNGGFLDVQMACADLVPLLEPLHRRNGIVVLRIAPIFHTEIMRRDDFVMRLGRFLEGLPSGYRYGVESGGMEQVSSEYLRCLHDHGVMPVLNGCEESLSLSDQVLRTSGLASQGLFVRVRIGCGRMMEMQDGILTAVRRSVADTVPLYVDVQMPWEEQDERMPLRVGLFLLAVMRKLDRDLAKLSPMRRHAA